MESNGCKKRHHIKPCCRKDNMVNFVFGHQWYCWIMKERIKTDKCSKFTKGCVKGNELRCKRTINHFHFIQKRMLLMISGHKFAFVIKYYISIILVSSITGAIFISAFIAWLNISHIHYKVHIIGFCQTTEAV